MQGEEYQQGRDAFAAGLEVEANPYNREWSDGAYNDWMRGFRDAAREYSAEISKATLRKQGFEP